MKALRMYTINYQNYCLVKGEVHKLIQASPSETREFYEAYLEAMKPRRIRAALTRLLKTKVF